MSGDKANDTSMVGCNSLAANGRCVVAASNCCLVELVLTWLTPHILGRQGLASALPICIAIYVGSNLACVGCKILRDDYDSLALPLMVG